MTVRFAPAAGPICRRSKFLYLEKQGRSLLLNFIPSADISENMPQVFVLP